MASDHDDEQLFAVDLAPGEAQASVPPAGVNKTFRHYDPRQQFLVPPSLDDWLGDDHLARFVAELVDEVLDLEPFLTSYTEVRGYLTTKQRMARKLRTMPGKAAYARRKAIVEPVFGQIDTCQGGKRVLLRGIEAAEAEWHLLIACHNFRKLFGVGGIAALGHS